MSQPETLTARRQRVEAEIETLKKARAEALLAGKPFKDQPKLDTLTNEIQALVTAEGIVAEKMREQAEQLRLMRKDDLQSALAGEWRDQLEDWEQLELAMKNAATLIRRMRTRGTLIGQLAHAITGDSVPTPLSTTDSDLAGWIAAALQSAINPSYRLAGLSLPAWSRSDRYPPGRDWRAVQEKRAKASIDPIIDGAQPRPKTQPLQIEPPKEESLDVPSGNSPKAA